MLKQDTVRTRHRSACPSSHNHVSRMPRLNKCLSQCLVRTPVVLFAKVMSFDSSASDFPTISAVSSRLCDLLGSGCRRSNTMGRCFWHTKMMTSK